MNTFARRLWDSGRPSRLEIRCPIQDHRIGAVYDVEELGGLVLCLPGFTARADDFELAPGVRHDKSRMIEFVPQIRPLVELPAHSWGSCRCGTWSYTPGQLRDGLDHPHGTDRNGQTFIFGNFTMRGSDG